MIFSICFILLGWLFVGSYKIMMGILEGILFAGLFVLNRIFG